jgi:hypothetical protein
MGLPNYSPNYNANHPQRQTGLNVIPRRIEKVWIAGQRGKPGLNADIQNSAESTRMVTDPDFEVLGTNASSDDVTYGAEGGVVLQTDGASGDQVILLPHLDTNQSSWSQVTWGTDRQVEWNAVLKTGTSIANIVIWAGLKLTNTSVIATDNDQVFFRFADADSAYWQAIASIGGTDVTTTTTVAVAASTEYHLRIVVNSSRVASFYINEALVYTSGALTDATDLIPYIGVQAAAAAAKDITVYGQAISREFGAS